MKVVKFLGPLLGGILVIVFYISLFSYLGKQDWFIDLIKIVAISIAFFAYGSIHHVMIEYAKERKEDFPLSSTRYVLATAFAGAFVFYVLGLYKVGCPN